MPAPTEACLRPGCDRSPAQRGLCDADYQVAWRLVRQGKTTWDALVAAGRILPPSRTHRVLVPGAAEWFLSPPRG